MSDSSWAGEISACRGAAAELAAAAVRFASSGRRISTPPRTLAVQSSAPPASAPPVSDAGEDEESAESAPEVSRGT